MLTPSGAPPSRAWIALAQDAINGRYLQELCFGILRAAGFSSIPSLKTLTSSTSASSGEPFNDRQPSDTLLIRSKTIARHPRLPFPSVSYRLGRTVANTLSIGLAVLMCTKCPAGKGKPDPNTRRPQPLSTLFSEGPD